MAAGFGAAIGFGAITGVAAAGAGTEGAEILCLANTWAITD